MIKKIMDKLTGVRVKTFNNDNHLIIHKDGNKVGKRKYYKLYNLILDYICAKSTVDKRTSSKDYHVSPLCGNPLNTSKNFNYM